MPSLAVTLRPSPRLHIAGPALISVTATWTNTTETSSTKIVPQTGTAGWLLQLFPFQRIKAIHIILLALPLNLDFKS